MDETTHEDEACGEADTLDHSTDAKQEKKENELFDAKAVSGKGKAENKSVFFPYFNFYSC